MKRPLLAAAAAIVGACGGHPNVVENRTPSMRSDLAVDRAAGLAAFETVRGVLQHPRCQNCHAPGDAPLEGNDGHVHSQHVLRGPTGHGTAGAECSTCHGPSNPRSAFGMDAAPGKPRVWRMPPPGAFIFVGIAPHALCEQLLNPQLNGHKDMVALRNHIDAPLVSWGWAPGFGLAAVSTSRDRYIAAWDTWMGAGAPCPN
ncbi:hypothetical protein LVJ94_00335 [Pendulispora rubella]|uniref:Isoquinoline 1-oxidoreductase subunit n=1 Tax=Pendulispora rubella TaxID=2741070 RepID=A0ABZ2L934_9BACT